MRQRISRGRYDAPVTPRTPGGKGTLYAPQMGGTFGMLGTYLAAHGLSRNHSHHQVRYSMSLRLTRLLAAPVIFAALLVAGACSDLPTRPEAAPDASRSHADSIDGGGTASTSGDNPVETCVTEGATRELPDGTIQVCRGGQWGGGG